MPSLVLSQLFGSSKQEDRDPPTRPRELKSRSIEDRAHADRPSVDHNRDEVGAERLRTGDTQELKSRREATQLDGLPEHWRSRP
jgi:hypothetical protein